LGGVRFYERREVKDLLAYLKLLVNPEDGISLKRIINLPPRGIGSVTLERIAVLAKTEGFGLYRAISSLYEKEGLQSLSKGLTVFFELIEALKKDLETQSFVKVSEQLIEKIGYWDYLQKEFGPGAEARIENGKELLSGLAEFEERNPEGDLKSFLDQVSLVSETTSEGETADMVSLMTLHNAKGLEFPMIIMTGMEEGLFPHSRSLGDSKELEEERRLCYVGMTRAKEKLVLTRALQRRLRGSTQWNSPSRFLEDIPDNYITRTGFSFPENGRDFGKKKFFQQRKSSPILFSKHMPPPEGDFKVGVRVRHPLWGDGVVKKCDGTVDPPRVTVEFRSVGVKQLAPHVARLERIP